ncbi:MAG: hypothetical protein IT236_11830 [Bacteroidia bacterium]|nr:hypothetical protein [Bacteroidia bacterium]
MNEHKTPQNNTGQNNSSATPEVIKPALPKGGGAIQGMGETFQADEFTGTASFSIPFSVTQCRGAEPTLGLQYSSGSGNGIFGLGFGLGISSISRQTSKGIPKYDKTDTFLFAGSDYLVHDTSREVDTQLLNDISYHVLSYRPRVEIDFSRIEHWVSEKEGSFWKVHSADNSQTIFGKTPQARISDPENESRIFEWLIEETLDAHGNDILFIYKSENAEGLLDDYSETNRFQSANRYPERICYGNSQPIQSLLLLEDKPTNVLWHFEMVMDYGEYDLSENNLNPHLPTKPWELRADSFSSYRAGFEQRTHRLCKHILMFHRFPDEFGENPLLVHALKLNYESTQTLSQLKQAEHIGYLKETNRYTSKSLPPVLFSYTAFTPEDGLFQTFAKENGDSFPGVADGGHFSLTDLYGEGIPGILYADGTSLLYREPLGAGVLGNALYAEWKEVYSFPIDKQTDSSTHSLIDFTGNGRLDLLVSNNAYTGYYKINQHNQWEGFYPLEKVPVTYRDPLNQHSDLTGNGLSDLVRVEEKNVVLYPAIREKGFANAILQPHENTLPLSKQSSPGEFLGFVDLIGAGQPQLVRITRGMVECWPSLGHGRFGKRIQLSNAPAFDTEFDSSRLRLVDLDGSGTTDLIYIYADHVNIFMNQSGNSFSNPIRVDLPEAWDNLSQVQLADVLGNGTNCLVYTKAVSKPQHWFYDFCNGTKPYLMNETNNQMGAMHQINYCASTLSYLKDKAAGKKWVTTLPFPTQVVSSVQNFDFISNTRLTSEFRYHHGYYDEVEREFRGFGCVERLDTESYEAIKTSAEKNSNLVAIEKKHYVPPVLSKTWYHTGAFLNGKDIRDYYRPEFFDKDVSAKLFPNDELNLNGNSDGATIHEAYRALKGQNLRHELYGLDGTEWANNPYTVSENQSLVKLLQTRGNNPYAVFHIHSKETISYQYERNPADPMVSQDFTLEIDDYGSVLRSCKIAYPRRGEALQQQKLIRAVMQQAIFTHLNTSQAHYLLSIPVEQKSYELNELQTDPDGYFRFLSLKQHVENLLPTASLLNWSRNYYFDADKNSELPLGAVSPEALPSRTETAELDITQTQHLFKNVLSEQELEQLLTGTQLNQGGFVHYSKGPESAYYWNPGSQQSYANSNSFYLPSSFTDPYKQLSEYTYDVYKLNVIKVRDPLANETSIEKTDYRLMAPQKIKDANGNMAEVVFDVLGMVVATSHYGHEGDARIGFAELSEYNPLPEPSSIEEILTYPENYLQNAASYFYYDAWSWNKNEVPVHALSLSAEKYPEEREATPYITINVAYNDGFGRSLQNKLQVREAGEVRLMLENGTISTSEANTRWLTSGAVRYNNKGAALQQYDPFYSNTHRYIPNQEYNEVGVSSTLFYDPLERVIRTEIPKARDAKGNLLTLITKTEWVDAIPCAWTENHFDANDTIKDSTYYKSIFDEDGNVRADSPVKDENEINSVRKAAVFYNTPNRKDLDNLGHPIRATQLLKSSETGLTEVLVSNSELDIQGQVLESSDPRLNEDNKYNLKIDYALSGQVIRTISVDAGTHWQLKNVVGNALFSCDLKQTTMRYVYDELQRPLNILMQASKQSPIQCVQSVLYGDSRYTENGTSLPYFKNAEKWNAKGLPVFHLDEAGFKMSPHYSLSGLPLSTGMQISQDYKNEVNWYLVDAALWRSLASEVEKIKKPEKLSEFSCPEPLATLLQLPLYTTLITYDALGRVLKSTDVDGNISYPEFYSTGLLKKVSLKGKLYTDTPSLEKITYDAKGQRTGILYGNGVKSKYTYNTFTYELQNLFTSHSNGEVLQNISYWYDGDGNVCHIKDLSCPTVFCNGQQVEPDADYTYDSLYRLIKATGREHAGLWRQSQNNGSLLAQSINDTNKLQNYTQYYTYDTGGNLLQEKHVAAVSNACYTRTMQTDKTSNRVLSSSLGVCEQPSEINEFFSFDVNGNQLNLGGLSSISWNYRNNIQKVILVERSNAAPDAEYYVYDGGGQRVRKVTERYANQGSILNIDETIYLGGLEIYLKKQQAINTEAQLISEWHTLRFEPAAAEWRYWIKGNVSEGTEISQVRYQLENHLNSSVLELDREAKVISWEEYYPYGGTAVKAGGAEIEVKRYRYSGKEKDANTGLYYYGMRYYCTWLCRWLSPDPAGTIDGLNLYAFVSGNPIKHVDVGGMVSTRSSNRTKKKVEYNLDTLFKPLDDEIGSNQYTKEEEKQLKINQKQLNKKRKEKIQDRIGKQTKDKNQDTIREVTKQIVLKATGKTLKAKHTVKIGSGKDWIGYAKGIKNMNSHKNLSHKVNFHNHEFKIGKVQHSNKEKVNLSHRSAGTFEKMVGEIEDTKVNEITVARYSRAIIRGTDIQSDEGFNKLDIKAQSAILNLGTELMTSELFRGYSVLILSDMALSYIKNSGGSFSEVFGGNALWIGTGQGDAESLREFDAGINHKNVKKIANAYFTHNMKKEKYKGMGGQEILKTKFNLFLN